MNDNKMIINSYGIMRSGIHCILGWIIQNLEDNSVNFYNNIKDINNLNNRLIKKNDTRINDIRNKITEKKNAKYIIKSFESKKIDFYIPKKDEINIIIIRNPYNNLASSIKYTEMNGEHNDIKIDKNFDKLWIEYSNFFINNNTYIKIMYDKFVDDEKYRLDISKKIGFFINNNKIPYLKMGGGSSFINNKNYLDREKNYINNINMQRLKNNRIIYNNWTIIKHMNKYINWVPNKLINNNRVNSLLTSSIETGQFTNYGPNVQLLEKIIREKLQIDNSKAVIVVSNGSVALHSLASGIEYYHNKKINWATQSFTFPPSAQGTLKDVKIVDIDKDGGLNLEELDNSINGIIVTNIFGNVVDIKKYEKWASDNNKFLIFDNAATPYTFYNGKSCCNYGNGCTISFHHTKPLGFGEGGAIIVDKKYENNIRCLNNFGIKLTDKYWVNEGNNYKMSDISAVYIIQYLDNFNKIIEKHIVLYDYFKKQIIEKKLPLKLFPSFHDDKKIMPSCFCLLFDESEKSYKIEKKLLEYNIFCRKYYNPLKYTKNTLEIYNKILCLPCNVDMDVNDIDYIINIILK